MDITVITESRNGHGKPLASLWWAQRKCAANGVNYRFLHVNSPKLFWDIFNSRHVLFNGAGSLRGGMGALAYFFSQMIRKRTVLYWHETDWAIDKAAMWPRRPRPIKFLRALAVRHARRNKRITHFHVCAYGCRMLERRFDIPRERTRVLHNCCNSDALAAYHLPRRCTPGLFVAVGAPTPRKGVDLMVEVARSVVEKRPESRFVWVGRFFTSATDVPYQELMDTANRYGIADHIDFVGWRDKPEEIVADAEAVILLSRDDPMPTTLMEGMALGRKTVAFGVGGVPEMLRNTGYIVPPGDVAGFARMLVTVQDSADEETAQQARRQEAISRFSSDAFADNFARLMRELS